MRCIEQRESKRGDKEKKKARQRKTKTKTKKNNDLTIPTYLFTLPNTDETILVPFVSVLKNSVLRFLNGCRYVTI